VRTPNSRRRDVVTRPLVAVAVTMALLGLSAGTSLGAPSGPVSFVDYSQCANGAPGTVDANPADCVPQGWLNGVLQANNSHFRESEVTPQRALLAINATRACTLADRSDCHSIQLTYQARKGSTHAYDSLATWNHTVVDADRCQGLTPAVQTAIGCGTSLAPDTLPITADDTLVDPVAPSNVSKKTSDHDLDSQQLLMYNGDLKAMTAPSHDAPLCSAKGCSDDYAVTTIYFAANAGDTIELLFGGHLGVSPVNRGGWGAGLGASNINGGPYHIKWTAADGASVGSRDNQIMGSSIQPLAEPGIASLSSPQTATPGIAVSSLADTVTISNANNPTGTAHFDLYGPFASATGNTCTGTPVQSTTSSTWVQDSGTTGGVGTYHATGSVSNVTFTAAGYYFWVVSVDADNNNVSSGPHGCNESTEQVLVSKLTPSGGTTILLDDSVAVTGDGTHVPTGSATFSLYDNDSTCAVAASLVYGPTTVNLDSTGAAATTANVTTVSGHTYRWKVTYSGDTIYASSTPSACTEAATIG
jgi:hypothetical protein